MAATLLVGTLVSARAFPLLRGKDDPITQYGTTFDGDENPLSEGGKWSNNGLDWTKIREVRRAANVKGRAVNE